jgi:hypothetical protein
VATRSPLLLLEVAQAMLAGAQPGASQTSSRLLNTEPDVGAILTWTSYASARETACWVRRVCRAIRSYRDARDRVPAF